jgi:hypothetical protein
LYRPVYFACTRWYDRPDPDLTPVIERALSFGLPSSINDVIDADGTCHDCHDIGHTALTLAAQSGNATTVRYLLRHGADVHLESHIAVPYAKTWTPLAWAIKGLGNQFHQSYAGWVQIFTDLLEAGADPTRRLPCELYETGDETYASIVMGAVNRGAIHYSDAWKIVEEFAKRGADLNGYYDHRLDGAKKPMSPLMSAVTCKQTWCDEKFTVVGNYVDSGRRAFVKLLLKYGADPMYGASRPRGIWQTALGIAILDGNVIGLQDLIEAGVDVTNEYWDSKGSMTPLLLAAGVPHKNAAAMVAMIIKQGVDPNFRPTAKITGVDGDGTNTGQTHRTALIHHLHYLGCFAEDVPEESGGSPTYWFNMFRQTGQQLLDLGANVCSADGSGRTPLTTVLAAKVFPDRVSWVKKILDGGAFPDMLDATRKVIRTPIDIAVHRKWGDEMWDGEEMGPSLERVQVVDLLLEAGAEPNTVNLVRFLKRIKLTVDFLQLLTVFGEEVARLQEKGEAVPKTRSITIAEGVQGKVWSNGLIPMLFKAGLEMSGRDLDHATAVEAESDPQGLVSCFFHEAGVDRQAQLMTHGRSVQEQMEARFRRMAGL